MFFLEFAPYLTTDRVVIKSKKGTYILFTNVGGIKGQILSFMAA
ncbi:hypothetical protein [Fictibacillus enclensis]